MVSAALAWELVVTALLCASVATCILLDAASIYKVLQKIRLYVYGALLMVFGRDKRWTRRPLDTATLAALGPTKTKRIIFIRHGESEWNLIFNKGPKPLLPFKAILGLVREIKMFFALDMGSVLYDSPLNQEGLEQAQELASLLRGDADWGDVPDPAQRDADAATLRGGADAPLIVGPMRKKRTDWHEALAREPDAALAHESDSDVGFSYVSDDERCLGDDLVAGAEDSDASDSD